MPNHPPSPVVMRFFQDVLNRGDPTACEALLDPDYADADGFLGSRPRDVDDLSAWLAVLRRAFPDGRYMFDDCGGSGENVVVTTTFQGTHLGPYLGRPATGAKISVGGVHLFRVAAGRIMEHRGYENTWPLLDVLDRAGWAGLGGHVRGGPPVTSS